MKKNLIADIEDAFALKERQDVKYKVSRKENNKKLNISVTYKDLSENINNNDIVFSPGLNAVIREARDLPGKYLNIGWIAVLTGLSVSTFYSKNFKAGCIRYGSFKAIKKALYRYRKLLKSWDSFMDIKHLDEDAPKHVITYYKNVAKFNLKSYNAGARTRKLLAKRTVGKDFIEFTNNKEGFSIKTEDINGPEAKVIHSMSNRSFVVEGLNPLKEEVMLAVKTHPCLTVRGMKYALSKKEEILK